MNSKLVGTVPHDGTSYVAAVEKITGIPVGSLPIAGEIGFLPIDRSYSSDNLLTLIDRKLAQYNFPPLHIETLLNQASDLLERAASERDAYDSLREKLARLLIELIEQNADIESYYSAEETKTRDIPIAISKEILTSVSRELDWTISSAMHLRENVSNHDPAASITRETRFGGETLGWHIHRDIRGLTAKEYMDDNILLNGAVTQYPAVAVVSFLTGLRSTVSQLASIMAKQEQTAGAKSIASESVVLESAKKSASDLRQHTKSNILDLKMLLSKADGAFGYVSQLAAIRNRFVSDFAEAAVRLKVASKRIEELYGFGTPLPDMNSGEIIHDRSEDGKAFTGRLNDGFVVGGPFDRQLIWCRLATNYVTSAVTQEQNFVLPISLTERIKAERRTDTFRQIVKKATEVASVSFRIEQALFTEVNSVRLRGISAEIVSAAGKKSNGSWSATLVPPEIGSYRRLDSNEWSDFEQSHRRTVVIGRIRTRERLEPADVVGLQSLHNLSPVSGKRKDDLGCKWTININRFSSQGEDLADIAEDIELNVLLACFAL